jgi:hypothetical protein
MREHFLDGGYRLREGLLVHAALVVAQRQVFTALDAELVPQLHGDDDVAGGFNSNAGGL